MECKYNLADVSVITEASSCTIREQVSQLELDMRGALHSTFNYPLHSTINFMDISMDFNASSESRDGSSSVSKTLIDGDNSDSVTLQLNDNLRASDIKDSTLSSKGSRTMQQTLVNSSSKMDSVCTNKSQNSSNDSSDNTLIQSEKVLLPDQSYPKQNQIQQASIDSVPKLPLFYHAYNNNTDWDNNHDDYVSDCDSSCLSFDVDDMSLLIDEDDDIEIKVQQEAAKILPIKFNNDSNKHGNSCYINNMIHTQVADTMWGSDYSRLSTIISGGENNSGDFGDCDVCRIMRMKRQKASTDLWSAKPRHRRFDSPSSVVIPNSVGPVGYNYTTTQSSSISENRQYMLRSSSKQRRKDNRVSTSPYVTKRASRPTRTPTRSAKKSSSSKYGANDKVSCRDEFSKLSTGRGSNCISERLQPEGMESYNINKENCDPASLTSVWGDSTKSKSRLLQNITANDSGFSSTNFSFKSRSSSNSGNNAVFCHQNTDSICKKTPKSTSDNTRHLLGSSSAKRLSYARHSKINSLSSSPQLKQQSMSPFSDVVPTPSPWKGDKKLIKKKLKQLSLNNLNGQSSIQTLGCF